MFEWMFTLWEDMFDVLLMLPVKQKEKDDV